MAQHDYNLANQSGADFRADLNNALAAIATVNSGATEPSTTFAHQLWVDTANSVLKIRNAANSDWITFGVSISSSNVFTGDLTGNVVGNVTGDLVGNVTGDLTGNADSADVLSTARTISLSGDVVGSVSFDGSANVDIDTVVQINSITLGTDTTGDYVESISGGTGVTITGGTGESSTPVVAIGQAVAVTSDVTFNTVTATDEFIGDLEGGVRFSAKADGALSKGDVVYISGVSGDVPTVAKAKADDASKMPAFGLVLDDANDNAALQVVTFGTIENLDTSNVSVGQILYVSTTAGEYTTTAPTGESSQIQNIGKVQRSHAAAGSIKVGGAGRSNATGNLNDGNIFIGNASNQASTSTLDTSIVPENTNLYWTTARGESMFDTRLATKDTGDLAEGSNLYYTTVRVNSDFDTRLATKDTGDLAEGVNLYYTTARVNSDFDTRLATKDTDDLTEGTTNLYYTSSRANTDFDTRLATKDTGDLAEGVNLYYTDARFDTRLATKDTDDLTEGTNLYYTQVRFDSAFSNKTTSDLTEGTNLYYTDARANSAIDTRVTKSFVDNLGVIAGSVQADSVALGTDTTGNYIQTITGTANKITVTGSGSESADVTLTLPDDVQIADSLTVAGNLTVNGTLTSLDTTNLDIEDNLFQLNAGLTGSPVNDSGMLINRGDQDNGIFMWDESVDKFTLGLTTADGTSTGNITLNSLGTLVANIEGDVTGDLTGTIQTSAQPNITSLGTLTGLTTTGEITANGGIALGDNDKATFGNSDDLQIYHLTNTYLENYTGNLNITNNSNDKNIQLSTDNGSGGTTSYILINGNEGTVNLSYYGSQKLITTSTGIDVTGTATMDGLTSVNTTDTQGKFSGWSATGGAATHSGAIELGQNASYQGVISYDSANETRFIFDNSWSGTGSTFEFRTNTAATPKTHLKVEGSGDISFYDDTGTTAKLFWDASAESLTVGGTGDDGYNLNVESAADTSLSVFSSSNPSRAVISTHSGNEMRLESRGGGAASILTMYTGAIGSPTERLRIDSSGRVGIGNTPNAAFKLDVEGAVRTNGTGLFVSENYSSGNNVYRIYDNSNEFRIESQIFGNVNTASSPIVFATSNTDGRLARMTITSSGNVGIGTSSPNQLLEVKGTSGTAAARIHADTITSPRAELEFMRGTTDTFGGDTYTDWKIGTVGATQADFAIISSDTTRGSNERLTIEYDTGNVGIGTTSPSAILEVRATAPTYINNGTVFWGGTTNNDNHNGIMLSSYGDALGGSIGSNLNYSNGTVSQTNTNRSSGEIQFSNTTVSGITSEIKFGGYVKGTTTFSERMRIDSSGNVGIGITSIATPLHVSSGIARTNTSKNYTQFISSDDVDDFLFGMAIAHKGGVTGSDRYVSIDSTSYQKSTDTFTTSGDLVLQQLGGNVGIGVVPKTWNSTWDALQIGASGSIFGIASGNENMSIASNAYLATDGNYKYIATNEASQYLQSAGVHYFRNVASGTADTNITWNDRMVIDSSGNVGIGVSPTNINGYKTLNVGAGTIGSIIKIDGANAGHYHRILNNNGQLYIQADQGNTTGTSAIVFGVDATERLRIDSSGGLITKPAAGGHAVFNEDSVDADFRVESDSNTHQLAVDAEKNNVLINNINTVTNSDNGSVIVGKGAVYYNQVLSMPSPYTGNVQIDLDFSSWGSNNTIAAVDVMILTRQYVATSGIAMGKMFATNTGQGGQFTTFTTTDITTSNCTFTASSPNNYRLRLVVNPSNNTDLVSIVLTIPTLSTSGLSEITAQIV